ncbi:MAG TPA: hypothetical protein VLL52_02500, partial [Anaerolineae bacterium]|nr:hypothetical protein [Anaerolineae bacterium]
QSPKSASKPTNPTQTNLLLKQNTPFQPQTPPHFTNTKKSVQSPKSASKPTNPTQINHTLYQTNLPTNHPSSPHQQQKNPSNPQNPRQNPPTLLKSNTPFTKPTFQLNTPPHFTNNQKIRQIPKIRVKIHQTGSNQPITQTKHPPQKKRRTNNPAGAPLQFLR